MRKGDFGSGPSTSKLGGASGLGGTPVKRGDEVGARPPAGTGMGGPGARLLHRADSGDGAGFSGVSLRGRTQIGAETEAGALQAWWAGLECR